MSFFANLFGYVLNFLYNLVDNYGVAIILFSILVKLIMLPMTIKQQRTLKKSTKIQEELKQIQYKYKNQPEQMNTEMMALYKRENMSPFSGCFSSIIQIVLLFAVFMLVRSPLTYMVKLDESAVSSLEKAVLSQEENVNNTYKEISIIQAVRNQENPISVSEEENKEDAEKLNEYMEKANLQMNFLGIDLSQVPTQDLSNWKTFIIPVLYVISSVISIKMTTSAQNKDKKQQNLITDGKEKGEEEINPMEDANKTMSWMMPIMSISIAIIAPLGLALYWLMNNILMIIEKVVINKILEKEEAKQNA